MGEDIDEGACCVPCIRSSLATSLFSINVSPEIFSNLKDSVRKKIHGTVLPTIKALRLLFDTKNDTLDVAFDSLSLVSIGQKCTTVSLEYG
jgi:hypothetical protein